MKIPDLEGSEEVLGGGHIEQIDDGAVKVDHPFLVDVSELDFSHWNADSWDVKTLKACDFTAAALQRNANRNEAKGGNRKGNSPNHVAYTEIDNSRIPKKVQIGARPTRAKREQHTDKKNRTNMVQEIDKVKKVSAAPRSRIEKQRAKQRQKEKKDAGWFARPKFYCEWSREPQPEWTNVKEISLNDLSKVTVPMDQLSITDHKWQGILPSYNRAMDTISVAKPATIPKLRLQNTIIDCVDDETLIDMLDDDSVEVIGTDQVLSFLMAASHGKYSWHLNFTYADGKLVIQKDYGSVLDIQSINESARNKQPTIDDPQPINRAKELHKECTEVQNDLRSFILAKENLNVYEETKQETGDGISMKGVRRAFRYRFIDLPPVNGSKSNKTIRIGTRATIDCGRKMSDGSIQLGICRAMLEYQSSAGLKAALKKQSGALATTEFRNNAPKMTRWMNETILSGVDTMIFGWTARTSVLANTSHNVYSVAVEKSKNLRDQLGYNPSHCFGQLRSIIDKVLEYGKEGEYMLIKDPTKPILRLLFTEAYDADE